MSAGAKGPQARARACFGVLIYWRLLVANFMQIDLERLSWSMFYSTILFYYSIKLLISLQNNTNLI